MTRSFLSPSDFSTFDAITKQVPKTHSRPTHLLCSWGEPAANQQRGHSAGAARTRSSQSWSRRLSPSPGGRLGREAPKTPPPYSLLFLSNAMLLGPLLPSSHSFAPGPSRSHRLRAQPALPCAPHTAARGALRRGLPGAPRASISCWLPGGQAPGCVRRSSGSRARRPLPSAAHLPPTASGEAAPNGAPRSPGATKSVSPSLASTRP